MNGPPDDATWGGGWRTVAGMVLGCMIAAVGCDRDVQIATAKSDRDQLQTEEGVREQLRTAIDFVRDYDRYREDAVLSRILNHLRKWSEPQRPDPNWIADPLFNRLPARLQLNRNPDLLSRLTFGQAEVELLRESLWMRDLAQRLSPVLPTDGELGTWLETEFAAKTSVDDAEALRKVAVIFDWVVRNIQIEPMELGRAELGDYTGPPPRPGVRRTAFEALLLGRGDALVRSRLVLLIARQLNIPCVMVGASGPEEPAPWWLGAVIGKEIYLFDPQLGIPLRDKGGKGIANLREVVGDSTLVNNMRSDPARPYRVEAERVKELAIWVDASPEALSQRMRLVERNLVGDQKLALTTSPSEIRLRLADHPQVRQIAIWTQPYDVMVFRLDPAAPATLLENLNRELAPLAHPWPLARARRQHIRGFFADKDFEHGARQMYMRMRIPEERREKLHSAESLNEVLKEILGEDQALPEEPAVLASLIAATQNILRVTKEDATLWLGLIAFEAEDYQVAVDYFEKRILQATPDGPWTLSAKYNLGRALEAMGRKANNEPELLRRAIQAYRSEGDSLQGEGNLWRARQIERLVDPPADKDS